MSELEDNMEQLVRNEVKASGLDDSGFLNNRNKRSVNCKNSVEKFFFAKKNKKFCLPNIKIH